MDFTFLTLGYHPDLIGGAYRYVTEVAERLAQRGQRVDVICPSPNASLPASEVRTGVHLHRFANEEGFFAANWLRENRQARVLLAERSKGGLTVCCHAYFSPALRQAGRRAVFLFTGPWAEEYRFARRASPRSVFHRAWDELIAAGMRGAERSALRGAQRILTISRYYQEQLPRWHGDGLAPVTMISGGVNTVQFKPAPDRAADRTAFGLTREDFLFVSVRRLDPRMGLTSLIEAFAGVSARFPTARLWLAGRGPQQPELEGRIKSNGLEGRVRLLGFVAEEELPRLLGAADCMVMPSLDLEGFGLATVESLACGTPVIGSRAGATPELLGPLSERLLFEAGSPSALAAKLAEVLSNPGILPDREQCREYVSNRFTWERPVQALEQCAAELCGTGGEG